MKRRIEDIRGQIAAISEGLEFDGDVQVEIRFDTLDYGAIRTMHCDPLLDVARNTPFIGGIRVIIGTIADLSDRTQQ